MKPMLMAGKMRQVERVPSESGVVCVFQTTVGERFSVVESVKARGAALIDVLLAA